MSQAHMLSFFLTNMKNSAILGSEFINDLNLYAICNEIMR